MITRSRVRRPALLACGAVASVLSLIPVETATDATTQRARPNSFTGSLVLERNDGQHGQTWRFTARGAGYRFAFADDRVDVMLAGESTHRIALRPVAADGRTSPVGEAPLAGRVHYLHGQDPAAWRTDIPTFGKVRYSKVWPGVDVVFYGNHDQLEYDVEVGPGADASLPRFALDGVESLAVTEAGDLVATVATRRLTFSRPIAYQTIDGVRRPVRASYLVAGSQFSFDIGAYDRSHTLVIDPVLVYSTFLGGSHSEQADGLAVDGAGNVYVTGTTTSFDFPTTTGAFQTAPFQGSDDFPSSSYVTKLSRTGALVYSTYVSAPDGHIIAYDVAVDGRGNAYVAGWTNAPGFPRVNAYQAEPGSGFASAGDAFLLELSASGRALVYSTFLGGRSTDRGYGVAVTPAGEAVVVGCTSSVDFPLVNAADATFNGDPNPYEPGCTGFATKVLRNGHGLVYSTYLTGSFQTAHDVALDAAGRAFITGYVGGDDLTTTANAAQQQHVDLGDGFIVRLGTTGAWQYATYLGGWGDDGLLGIAVDSAGNMYVTGQTEGGFPTTPGAYQRTLGGEEDAVIAQVAGSGGLTWSTFLGGPGLDAGRSIDLDLRGRVVVAGFTASDLPATADAVQPSRAGLRDGFVVAVRPGIPALEYLSYLGGAGMDQALALVTHISGRITLAGSTGSADFPLLNAADDENTCEFTTCNDGFVTQQAERQPGTLPDGSIVLHATDAAAVHGRWRRVADPAAAGGFRLELPDAGAARVPAPAANPADYFEVNATVHGGMDGESYVLWVRGRAERNSFNNDSVFVQFSNAMTGNGPGDRPIWQIGTTEAQTITLEDCANCGLSGWAWQDASFGIDVRSVPVQQFAGDEVTIRVQAREDGIAIDQLVLVPRWANVAPGFQKDDDTLYPAGRTDTRDIVLYPGVDVQAFQLHGAWRVVDDPSAAGGRAIWHPNAGAPKIAAALPNPTHYVELTFHAEANTAYAFWVRGKADGNQWSNDSVFVQLTNTVWPIGSTAALEINLQQCYNTGLSGWMWRSDTWCAAPDDPEPKIVFFSTRGFQTIRVQTREDGMRIDQIVFGRTGTLFEGPPPAAIVSR